MYLNLVQIAESFGVSERTIEDWMRAEGLPHTLDRGRPLFDRAQVVEWAAGRGLGSQAGFLAPETRAPFSGLLQLEPLLRTGGIWREVPVAGVPAILGRIVEKLPGCSPPVRRMLAQRLAAPGGLTLAPVGFGFALPHPSTRIALGRDSGVLALLLLREAWPEAGALDGIAVTRLLFFIAPSPRAHLDLLGRLSRTLKLEAWRNLVARGASDSEIFLACAELDEANERGGRA